MGNTTENGSFFIDFIALLKKTEGNTIYIKKNHLNLPSFKNNNQIQH